MLTQEHKIKANKVKFKKLKDFRYLVSIRTQFLIQKPSKSETRLTKGCDLWECCSLDWMVCVVS